MARAVHRTLVSTWFRLGVLLTIAGCSPIAGSEPGVESPTDDAGNGTLRDDAGRIISFTQATIHVAGLRGRGLALTLDGSQQLDVPSDGIWKVPLAVAVSTIDLAVRAQPVEPHQRCDITKIDARCRTT
jgi:hypothetical protein